MVLSQHLGSLKHKLYKVRLFATVFTLCYTVFNAVASDDNIHYPPACSNFKVAAYVLDKLSTPDLNNMHYYFTPVSKPQQIVFNSNTFSRTCALTIRFNDGSYALVHYSLTEKFTKLFIYKLISISPVEGK